LGDHTHHTAVLPADLAGHNDLLRAVRGPGGIGSLAGSMRAVDQAVEQDFGYSYMFRQSLALDLLRRVQNTLVMARTGWK